MQLPFVSISIVSHNQAGLVHELLRDLEACGEEIEVILTLNIRESLPFHLEEFRFPIQLIKNEWRKGFGANHNQAFAQAKGPYFCVLNPDIRIEGDPFPLLIRCLEDKELGVVAPKITNVDGEVEDSARHFPTPFAILRKVLRRRRAPPDYAFDDRIMYPDWVGGMFMLFRSDVFNKIIGFDERYFLYYEDVDLCARLQLQKYKVAVCPDSMVLHNARRQSHRDFKYFKWHLSSMMRFFLSPVFLKILWFKR